MVHFAVCTVFIVSQFGVIALAIGAVNLAWDTMTEYLGLQEATDEGARTTKRLLDLLRNPALASLCEGNPSRALQDMLARIEGPAQEVTKQANKIRSMARWQRVAQARHYFDELLKSVAGLETRVNELLEDVLVRCNMCLRARLPASELCLRVCS